LLLFCVLASVLLYLFAPMAPRPNARAQELTYVVVARQALATPVGSSTLAQEVGSLTAMADGNVCARVLLTGPSNSNSAGDKVIVLGTNEQPAACSTPGAEIALVDGRGRCLAVTFSLAPGATFVLDNLAPQPPHAQSTCLQPLMPLIGPPAVGDAGLVRPPAGLVAELAMD